MRKHSLLKICLSVVMLFTCMVTLSGCFSETEDTTPKEYTIQYTDDTDTHQITVTEGMTYSLDVIPERTGYTFLGLFDAEVGGTQYVSSTGSSLSTFTDGKNIVLFPQYKADEYSIVLDYQDADVTGARQITVSYGDSLPELPKNLVLEHKVFNGWYTEADCSGTQVADKFGLIPVVSVLNEKNFDLTQELIYLYAGFEIEKFDVTCHFTEGTPTEVIRVEYNTSVSQIVPETRVNGMAPLTWSKTEDGEIFNGKITSDTELYVKEYAPVLELDTTGGNEIKPVIARAGSTIVLPTPTKDLAKFAYWEDMQGNRYDSTTMPSTSISLKAVWQGKLVFDSNGGSSVDDISVASGNSITLPSPTRDGFVFAGWYTETKEQYTATRMPAEGLKLKAGWYKEERDTVVLISSSSEEHQAFMTAPKLNNLCFTISHDKFTASEKSTIIGIDWNVRLKTGGAAARTISVDYYSVKTISSNYLLKTESFTNVTDEYKRYTWSTAMEVSDDFYACFYISQGDSARLYLSDLYYTVRYPNTTNLYL